MIPAEMDSEATSIGRESRTVKLDFGRTARQITSTHITNDPTTQVSADAIVSTHPRKSPSSDIWLLSTRSKVQRATRYYKRQNYCHRIILPDLGQDRWAGQG